MCIFDNIIIKYFYCKYDSINRRTAPASIGKEKLEENTIVRGYWWDALCKCQISHYNKYNRN